MNPSIEAASGSPPVLDSAALNRLRQLDPGGQADVVGRVLRTYESSLVKSLTAMDLAIEKGDLVELQRLAHTLKSSSASVGALALADVCARTEACLRGGDKLLPVSTRVALQAQGQLALQAVRQLLSV